MLRIGQLARSAGSTPKTIRYYEDVGLLRPSRRSESNYRLYDNDTLERLAFVRRAQGLGLRLTDIKRILEISDEGRVPCDHVIGLVDRQLADVSKQMARLRALRRDLTTLRARLAHALQTGSAGPGGACPCFDGDISGEAGTDV